MRTLRRIICFTLALCFVFSLAPSLFAFGAESEKTSLATNTAHSEEKPATKAVSIGGISIPAYSGGTASTWMTYEGGNTVSFHDGAAQSKMQIIKGTTATQYNSYCSTLGNKGYTKVWSRTLAAQSGSNRYAKFLSPDGTYSVYTYFTPYTSQTRIIVDTHKDTVDGFYYDGKGSDRTEVYMYNLTAPDNGYAYTASDLGIQRRFPNGSMFVIKMSDNSLFVIDGGSKLQMSERAMSDLYDFCREITGLPEGQKMIISAWHLSHIHTDHSVGFSRFLTKYSQEFELKNIIYNTDYVAAGEDNEQALSQVGKLFPNARYYKPHTGEQFKIAGVTFDVLYTAEDWYKPNSNNKLIVRDSACLKYSNDNNTSMALRMSFDGKTALWLGDLEKADADLMGMYPAANLKSDILQLPHHLLDDHTTLVKTIEPTISFANQSKEGAYTRGKVFNYITKIADYAGTIYYAGNETVGYCAEEGVFYRKDHVEFDYGNWTNTTCDIRDVNPVSSETVKAAEQFYRYSRAKELKSGLNSYAIVDHTTGWAMSFDAINGGADRATPAHYINDTFYFADSQRRLVNWQIQYSQYGANANAIVSDYGNYYGTVTIDKGSGGYWGTPKKNTGMYFGYNDTFEASGMYDSWSAFSNQLEAGSKGVWLDKMNGGTFLIYRYHNGSYYPLYRDGDVFADNGWGVAKLTHSQARNKCHYLKNRLYIYEETPSDMLITWAGHSDYYVYCGVNQYEVISHIVSDLRVNYSLPAFGATGEISYDFALTKDPGTYRLEFTKTLNTDTVGDYPAVIRYINPNGTIQDLGCVTVHVEARDLMEDGGAELFFGFGDTPADKLRYRLEPQYNHFNFDSDKRWTMYVYDNDGKKNVASSLEGNPHEGTMEIVIEDKNVNRKIVNLDLFAGSQFPLTYDPQHAEVLQVRLKLDNIKAYGDKNPYMRLWYYGTDEVRHFDEAHYFGKNFVSDGEYMTVTIDLYDQTEVNANASASGGPTKCFRDMGEISSIRLCFYYFLVNNTSKNGSITIDHIYIGPKAHLPEKEDSSLLFDFTNTEADQARYADERYKGYNFDIPEKATWVSRETSTTTSVMTNFSIDNEEGVVKIPVAEDIAYEVTNGLYGPWFVTAAIHGTHSNATMPSTLALAYDPAEAEILRVRFKVDGCTTISGSMPELVTIFDRTVEGTTARGANIISNYSLKNGEWMTLTVPLSEEFSSADYITTLGLRFRSIKAIAQNEGSVTIDYIYVGPEGGFSDRTYSVEFRLPNGTVLSVQRVREDEAAVYNGPTPTMTPDESAHYTFSGWDTDLSSITADTIVTAQFTASEHSYTYKTANGSSHIASCACGYSKSEDHSFRNGECICGARELITDTNLRINHSLNLESDISLNYVVMSSYLQGYDSFWLECNIPEYNGNTYIGMETLRLEGTNKNNAYYFVLDGLTAVQMNDSIQATLHMTKDGAEYVSAVDSYSIAKYAYSQLDKANAGAELKTLCANLLRYGAAAQTYKTYRTEALCDSAMTETHRSYLSDLDSVEFGNNNRDLQDVSNPTVSWTGKTLLLDAKVTLRYVVNIANYDGSIEDLILKVRFVNLYGETITAELTEAVSYNGIENLYAFDFAGLEASELRCVVSAAVYAGDTQVSTTLEYSADTYCNGKTGTLGTLCKALFAYSDSALAYFR